MDPSTVYDFNLRPPRRELAGNATAFYFILINVQGIAHVAACVSLESLIDVVSLANVFSGLEPADRVKGSRSRLI